MIPQMESLGWLDCKGNREIRQSIQHHHGKLHFLYAIDLIIRDMGTTIKRDAVSYKCRELSATPAV